jgi:hypothetical protein
MRGAVAHGGDGRVLWRISVENTMFYPIRPIAVPGGVAFVLATGLVVVLDWTRTD